MKHILMIVLLAVLATTGCTEKKPTEADGQGSIRILAQADTSLDGIVPAYIPASNAVVSISSEYGIQNFTANTFGYLEARHLPASKYTLSVRSAHPLNPTIFFYGTKENLDLTTTSAVVETLVLQQFSATGIVMNELYVGGPVNSSFFFYDQFIELYNATSETKYLDGVQVMRISGNQDEALGQHGPGYDEFGDGQIQGVTYIFVFPGKHDETHYPIQPGQFMVLAQTAVDNRTQVTTSIDHSHADWEFYNPFSAVDLDNPNVPNIKNIRSDKTVDFLVNLSSDILAIADGSDENWVDGIKISSVLDAVEYHSAVTARKTLDTRCDRSFTVSPARYSGKSMQRKVKGMDSNNSRMDFEILPKPTPGYQ